MPSCSLILSPLRKEKGVGTQQPEPVYEKWTRQFVVVLNVTADMPVGTYPEWWETVGLPPPWEWADHFPEAVHVEEVYAKELMT